MTAFHPNRSPAGHNTMRGQSTSVLIPSYGRPEQLVFCLKSLATQDVLPDEVIVVWQADDAATRNAAEHLRATLPYPLFVLHSPMAGVVPAENEALLAASGEVILLIDDDAIAPKNWVARHLTPYDDPSVGAVGGSAVNIGTDGVPFPTRTAEPVGRLTWFGRSIGNMYDHVPEWRDRPIREVDHLVGYNMSLRRSALDRFDAGLKRYWQMFEMDACLQVRSRGFRVLFDFGNVVEHHPTNTVYTGGREGNLETKIYHGAYNHAFVLAKHSPLWLRPARLGYLLGVGSTSHPGLLAFFVCGWRYGHIIREMMVLARSWRYHLNGWIAGTRARARRVGPRTVGQPQP